MRPPYVVSRQDRRVLDVVSVGVTVGVVCWGAVGAWTALTTMNYPWNVWIPFANGASKGALLGLLAAAAVLVVSIKGFPAGWRWSVLVVAFIGGALWGTIRDLLGPPAPAVSFLEPLSGERWYGATMLLHWIGKVAAPAAVCAVVLTLVAGRPYRKAQSVAAGAALMAAGLALVLLPVIATMLVPEVTGNGEHANEGVWAQLRCWVVGIPVFLAGLVRFASLQGERRVVAGHTGAG
ncbi:hypothetical protein ACIBEJ_39775 [Nonomuraea sp. NPDC050790]|uniref:hypothetical protein n=1 Tax=Nonomuraea sp. NPDC050790 TaxID=3364371 RepID=UPI0037AAF528